VTTKYLAKFQSPRAITQPKIIGPEQNVNLIYNLSLYTHILDPPTHGISNPLPMVFWLPYTWYFEPPTHGILTPLPMVYRTLSYEPLSFGRNVYTHIPNIKSISQSIAKKSGDNCFISELRTWATLYVPVSYGILTLGSIFIWYFGPNI
jgi:hypothetical protein